MNYYKENLSARKLKECYDIAPPRIKQYLDAEVQYIISRLNNSYKVLELGCGYGRVIFQLAPFADTLVGIDISPENIAYAEELHKESFNCESFVMDATDLVFPDNEFDVVICNQNGICAFNVDQVKLVREALRVTRKGGLVIFSSYSDKIWPHRLEWFKAQSAAGLLGELDLKESRNGIIVCKDGFRAGSMNRQRFADLCNQLGVDYKIAEIDESCIFCEIIKS